ncbi:hypothetical protein [Nocardioides sp. zg-DK7169]|uniref:hypothetical protein n=1 Tax=Nocardioides sp. zg-DK7169 TaxID=2736600 RepID=UPI001553E6ED|nr:hypothetical protein [Nocardioides sp. zg-DK7169]NPC96611.1 hypothetical protein [Nocardioides sp. zg-DK7169]
MPRRNRRTKAPKHYRTTESVGQPTFERLARDLVVRGLCSWRVLDRPGQYVAVSTEMGRP